MKHLLIDKYFKAVANWDRSHRLVGRSSFSQLFEESILALENSVPRETSTLVDIGAGSGLLGVPFLFLRNNSKVIFVEADIKKASFLLLLSTDILNEYKSRIKVIAKPYESVSRETVEQFADIGGYILAARAFSGPKTLKEAHFASEFSDREIFSFESDLLNKDKPLFKLLPLIK